MLKIFERIKNEIIYRWEDTVTTDLLVEFIELNEHSVIIPAPQKRNFERCYRENN